ncbi:hypothetical protein [Haliscomenobacter sp.]|uniref:hypothetical protein n=1 Tax=Haliscomenobacter sp. TaxID=2717303 RepID=UPI003364B6AF
MKGDNLISKLRTNNSKQGGVIPQAIPNDVPAAYLSFDDLASNVLAALEKPELKGKFIPIGGRGLLEWQWRGMEWADRVAPARCQIPIADVAEADIGKGLIGLS